MSKRIYVGNLPFDVSHDDVRALLKGHEPDSVDVKTNEKTKSAMASIALGDGMPNAIVAKLNGQDFQGRKLVASTDRNIVVNHEEQYG